MKSLYLPGVLATCLAFSSAWAAPGAPDAESVPVDAQLDPNNPFALFRPNVFDLDSIKVLTFTGTAVQLFDPTGAPTAPGTLTGFFDWRDPSGVSFFSTPVEFHMAPNQPISIQFSWVVDFCPEQVSLHFEAEDGAYDVEGVFTHECMTALPEATTVAPSLALAAGVAGWVWRRRRATV